jgi:hypothetical protein
MPYPFVPSTCRRSVPLICVAVYWLTLLLSGAGSTAVASEQGDLHGSVSGAGIRAFVPGRWGLARATVTNPTQMPQTYRVMAHFIGRTDRQFLVDVWVPPRARREVEWPVRLIKEVHDPRQASVEMRGLLLPGDGGGQTLDEQPGTLLIVNEHRLTAMMSDGEDEREAIAMVDARKELGLGRRATYASTAGSPQHPVGWDGASVLVLSTDQPNFDPAQRDALRQWIAKGGVLWVWSDQVDPQSMALLLGDAWGIETIDHVTLTKVEFTKPGPPSTRAAPRLGPVEVEKPLRMARVIAPDYKTLLSVRGWPAVLERRIGDGRLIVSTLEGRAWAGDRVATARRTLAESAFADGPEPGDGLATRDAAARFVSQQVGRPVVPRRFIAVMLGLLVAALAVGGVWFGRRGQLERVALVAIGASLVVVIVFQVAGRMQRGSAGPIDVALQIIQAAPGNPEASISGALGIYAPTRRQVTLTSNADGWAWPQIESGEMQKLISQGLGRWQWQALTVGEGTMRLADYSCSTRLDPPVETDLTFTDNGLAGTVTWPTQEVPSDMLLATPLGTMLVAPSVREGRTLAITVNEESIVAPGTYFAAGMISQTRRQRAALLDDMFAGKYWPAGPTLLGWTEGIALPISISGEATARDTALWAVPLTTRRAETGTTVRVPWPFIPMRPAARTMTLPLFNRVTGRWDPQARSSLSTTFIGRFQLPASVLPLGPTGATLELDMSALKRTVTIVTAGRSGKSTEVAEYDSPDGPITVTIPGEALWVDKDGGVAVGFEVGRLKMADAANAGQSAMWQVRAMHLSVTGKVQQPAATGESSQH